MGSKSTGNYFEKPNLLISQQFFSRQWSATSNNGTLRNNYSFKEVGKNMFGLLANKKH